jgi:hypothetical protein
MSTTPHLLISSFHNVSDQLSFISSYYMSIPSQPCFPHLLCNAYHPTSYSIISLFHNVSYFFKLVIGLLNSFLLDNSCCFLNPFDIYSTFFILS